ncbi:polysaccharide biosynthesis protein [Chitinophaga sp. Ak27]|uniref:polysaccharide biosynthesis protein n=1 Tax=Chitinophaga sp. Ak27 TaxID=2726116 RepID=UPI00145F4F14|nr:polysaccharide biosynthesis protein [Chitinophaga sp. Ak27]NLU94410.1 polysaccharide biosynthesis protein [Chitinophaga sp. Ak27]
MSVSYTKNYFKIYFWKFIGYFASFASLGLVTPRITSSPALYGIFAFCMSLNIFFQYADLGFINAAQKYASEFFGKKDLKNEIRVTGFSCFMFILFIIPVNLGMLFISFHPEFIIKGISTSADEWKLSSHLLFTLFCFAPILVLQRIVQIIFSVRLEDYYPQRINLVAAILRIVSVFYFFGNGKYELFEYFLFYNCLSLISLCCSVYIARKRYKYDFILLLKSFRFSKDMYDKTSALAFNSLALAFSWILYFELDLVYIGFFLGKNAVAHYAIGFTVLTFFRDAYGTFYYPFMVRFNHFVGTGNAEGLKELYHILLKIGVPIVVLPLLTMIALSSPIIISWVGRDYDSSVNIVRLLTASALFGFITYPAGGLLTARVQLRSLYVNAITLPLIFFAGVLLTQHYLGVLSYALFKVISIYVNVVYLLFITLKYFHISLYNFLITYLKHLILPIIFIGLTSLLVTRQFTPEKGIHSLIISVACYGGTVIGAMGIYWLTDKYIQDFFKGIFTKLITKKH